MFERHAIVSRTDIADAMLSLQQTEKALETAAQVAISHELVTLPTFDKRDSAGTVPAVLR